MTHVSIRTMQSLYPMVQRPMSNPFNIQTEIRILRIALRRAEEETHIHLADHLREQLRLLQEKSSAQQAGTAEHHLYVRRSKASGISDSG